ncbi:AAA family ATPase [Daldinia childiae]|uniref:AAA family ATPase n=1 Tax=Daldinia childiae TaxID=326645 RepID=UPI001447E6BC|nr:AAA family ATPase [Daldinia childiae]KAF3065209.1 AAA family ATPase [Daldinia childiae]
MYLDEPQWMEGENAKGEALAGNLPVRDIQSYLERNPEICFVVYRDFSVPVSRKRGIDHTLSVPKHDTEMIETTTADLTTTVTKFMSFYGFSTDVMGEIGRTDAPDRHFTDVDGSTELLAPYPAFYHASRQSMGPFLESLENPEKQQFQLLLDYVMSNFENEYDDAEKIIGSGRITKRYFQYLFKPGDVIVQKETDEARGLICSSWVTEDRIKDGKRKTPGKASMIKYTIQARHWTFDGVFSHKSTHLKWEIDDNYNSKLEINGLNICPLDYVDENLRAKLQRRGEWIWKCRTKQLVSYHEDENRQLHDSDDERYMIDMMVYRELHKPDKKRDITRWISPDHPETDDLSPEAMKRDYPPSDEFLYVLPSIIKGFNLKKKKWLDLKVDNLGEVVWNKTAFERLVLEEKTKKLILALVSDQVESKRSTDLISGKGNGLIMLLHGGPGTGKTLTAESVAEIARKPLYPVTCGDIGTEPEAVENYLESVLHLGKTWGCVVLLDEADVFLEQRSLQDLHRNALVSVFLRVLEYYEGILVLTSNRVGTFDEAFKSRIQLAIHYNYLSFNDRSKIWGNFISRVQDFEEEEIDAADLKDHIKDLAQFEMNGREIRNAITNARQYTRWERKQQQNPENCKLDYAKIKLIIDTASKFDDYIKKLNGGYNYIAVDDGLRLEG